MASHSKSNELSRAKEIVSGTKKHFTNPNQQVQFANETHTIADVLNTIDGFISMREDAAAAKAMAKAKLETERIEAPKLLAFIAAWVAYIRATFGSSPEALGDFGLTPKKAPAPKTAADKATAAAKRKATRDARHTMGKRQRADVKGNVEAKVVVTPLAPPQPVASSPSAATPPSPAPVAGGGAPNGSGTPHGQ